MIQSIIEGISLALNAEFKEKEYTVYAEEVKQDLKEPCFFIFALNPDIRLFFGRRYFRSCPFVVQYIPVGKDVQQECNDAAGRLMMCLEYIKLPGETQPVRGTQMRYEIQDGVLQFFVNYDLFVLKVAEETDAMEELVQDSSAE